jgi:hypothetical protein
MEDSTGINVYSELANVIEVFETVWLGIVNEEAHLLRD